MAPILWNHGLIMWCTMLVNWRRYHSTPAVNLCIFCLVYISPAPWEIYWTPWNKYERRELLKHRLRLIAHLSRIFITAVRNWLLIADRMQYNIWRNFSGYVSDLTSNIFLSQNLSKEFELREALGRNIYPYCKGYSFIVQRKMGAENLWKLLYVLRSNLAFATDLKLNITFTFKFYNVWIFLK